MDTTRRIRPRYRERRDRAASETISLRAAPALYQNVGAGQWPANGPMMAVEVVTMSKRTLLEASIARLENAIVGAREARAAAESIGWATMVASHDDTLRTLAARLERQKYRLDSRTSAR